MFGRMLVAVVVSAVLGSSASAADAVPINSFDPFINQLNSDSYRERESASRALRAAGWDAVPALRLRLPTAPPEAARRIEILIQEATRLEWHADPTAAFAAAKKSGKSVLFFSTVGEPKGFA